MHAEDYADRVKEIASEVERWRARGTSMSPSRPSSPRAARRPGRSDPSSPSREQGELAGSVSGGCVESDVALQAREVLDGGEPRLVTYGITDDLAWSVGLPCGGEIDVFVERL